jgi:hypothetical protein
MQILLPAAQTRGRNGDRYDYFGRAKGFGPLPLRQRIGSHEGILYAPNSQNGRYNKMTATR